MYKYYIRTNANVIIMLGKAKKVPNKEGYTEVTKAEYDEYMGILESIEEKAGYTKKVTLYIDGTFDVQYVPITEVDTEE